MEFADPQEKSTAYLILRHIYDGDVIEWPIADDHPLRHIFLSMEQQGFIARWDRTWPLHDRYRLTDRGIAAIEAVYKPGDSEAVLNDLRRQNLNPVQRRSYLSQRGYDPYLWPLLHDPTTQWDSWYTYHGRYHDWFWEDQYPYRSRYDLVDDSRSQQPLTEDVPDLQVPDTADPGQLAAGQYVMDLDREAAAGGADPSGLMDHDVS